MNKKYLFYIIFLFIILLVILIDQLTKYWVMALLRPGQSISLFSDYIYITYVFNEGGAFSLFSNFSGMFIFMGFFIPVLIIFFFNAIAKKGRLWIISAGLIVGGAFGNLFDRLKYGHVIDFINVRIWPIFNFADIAISLGIIVLFIQILREERTKNAQGPV